MDFSESDPDIEIIDKIDKDSGMASKDDTPERKNEAIMPREKQGGANDDSDDEYDDEPDETLSERLWGLTEMFPDPVRNVTARVTDATVAGVKFFYAKSCSATWIFVSSALILISPVVFEMERAQVIEMQKTQQNQVLLGTGGGGGGGMPGMPQM